MTTPAAFLAAHAAPLPAAVDLASLFRVLEALPRVGLGPALALSESYLTIEAEGRPVATLSRPRMYGGDGLYCVTLTDGRLVAAFDRCPTFRRCLEAVYSYARSILPDDCDAREELESYLASFSDNWAAAHDSAFATFRASALTRCARWARRIALARAALEGPTDDGRKSLDDLEAEDRAAKAAERAARKSLDDLEAEARAASLGVALAGAAIGAARRMTEAPAGLALAPVTPALESPLVPFAPGASRVALAIARGYDPARLIAGDFGPRARSFVGGF